MVARTQIRKNLVYGIHKTSLDGGRRISLTVAVLHSPDASLPLELLTTYSHENLLPGTRDATTRGSINARSDHSDRDGGFGVPGTIAPRLQALRIRDSYSVSQGASLE